MRLKFSKNAMKDFLGATLIFMMALGSYLYIYSESFAIGTVIALLLTPWLILDFIRQRSHTRWDALLFGSLICLVVFAVIGILINPHINNLRYLKAFLFTLAAFLVVVRVSRMGSRACDLGLLGFGIVVCSIGFLQITFLYFGFGMDPTQTDVADYIANDPFARSGVRSIFANPNDFATVCLLLMIYIAYRLNFLVSFRSWFVLILSIMIMLSASRLCVVALLLILGSYYITNRRGINNLTIIALLIGGAWYIFGEYVVDLSDGSYWITKIHSIGNLADYYFSGQGGLTGDGSADTRLGGYGEFFLKFLYIGLGSFDADNYDYILSDMLLRQNPHSLMIEMALLFGYPGFIIFWVIIGWLLSCIRKRVQGARLLLIIVSVFLITFTSSSEINFPAFWVIIFAIGAGSGISTKEGRQEARTMAMSQSRFLGN